MSVSISEIIAGASVHAVPLAGECAGYLVLAAADQAVAAPRRIGPAEVHLLDDGSVRVEGARAAAETDAEADLRALLDALLVNASSATPALLRASRRASGRGIPALVREIETALIPVNRSAAHRALARLERETERARQAGRIEALPLPRTSRSEPAKLTAPVAPTPAPAPSAPSEPSPAVMPSAAVPPSEPSVPSELLLAALPEIPSLLTPSVDAIQAYAAEIETRPEPIVVRRSAPPPPRTPTPPPLPVASPRPSPLPPVTAQPTTPVFGTQVQSHSDDEMDIEVVFDDDDLADDELTGVLVRSAPLEVSAMLEPRAVAEVLIPMDPTEPCPPALEDDPDETSALAFDAEGSSFLALVEESSAPPVEPAEGSAAELPAVELAAEAPPASEATVAEAPPAEALPVVEAPVVEALPVVEAPVVVAPPAVEPLPVLEALPPVEPLPVMESPPDELFAFEVPPVDPLALEVLSDESLISALPEETADLPPVDGTGLTQALALGIEPVVALPPAPRLPLPKARPSDVDDLLERMAQSGTSGSDELRSSLKGIAGLEPTPPPPET